MDHQVNITVGEPRHPPPTIPPEPLCISHVPSSHIPHHEAVVPEKAHESVRVIDWVRMEQSRDVREDP